MLWLKKYLKHCGILDKIRKLSNMGLLCKRKETDKEIIIVYKYLAIYYYIIFLLLLFLFIPLTKEFIRIWFFPILFFIVILKTILTWKPNQELRRAMKKGEVKISGSRFSLKNPFIVKIEK